jgi:transcriptional regulator with XRE-family HTH domain
MAKSFDDLVKRTATKRTRARAARRTKELLGELLLSELRQLAGKSQQQLAAALGIRQPSLSKLENQDDMQISTLRRIVQALGGKLEVIAKFPKGAVKIDQFDGGTRRGGTPRRGTEELHLV